MYQIFCFEAYQILIMKVDNYWIRLVSFKKKKNIARTLKMMVCEEVKTKWCYVE